MSATTTPTDQDPVTLAWDTTTTTPATYLDMKQVATRTGYSHDYVRELKLAGKLPAPDALHGTRQLAGWLPATVDRWVATRPDAPVHTTTPTTTTEET